MKDYNYYKNSGIFLDCHLFVIREGLEKKLDVSIFAKKGFSLCKMFFIKRCLEHGFDYNYIINLYDDNLIEKIYHLLKSNAFLDMTKEELETKINLLTIEH